MAEGSPGTLVAERFRLVEILGRGGFGTVWRAFDERLRADVTLKEIRCPADLSEAERDEIEARLDRECQISAALRKCPHVVTTLDVVRDVDDDPWIVMDYYPSRTLRAVLDREGRLALTETAAIGTCVLEALQATHAADVVHRDVTPANILLGTDGSARLTDFGAAVRRTDQRVTAGVLGVPGFVAPEVLAGHAARPGADVFALGVTLFTAVEGQPPFDPATWPEASSEHPGRAATTTLSGPLGPLFDQMLAPDPAARPTVDQALAAIWEFLDDAAAPAARGDLDAAEHLADLDEMADLDGMADLGGMGVPDVTAEQRLHEATPPDEGATVFPERRISRAVLLAAGLVLLFVSGIVPAGLGGDFNLWDPWHLLSAAVPVIAAFALFWRAAQPTGHLTIDADRISLERGWYHFTVHWSRIDTARVVAGKLAVTLMEGDIPLQTSQYERIWPLPRYNARTGVLTVCRLSRFRDATPAAVSAALDATAWPHV
ncbi:serine/threonine-protein kinase [Frankia gtarii]|uniref:serine/threonine-protein kinase n=1 Tax=Frankia gtarii TaxID=2950102 RepID=UPI0021C075CE|nr:serine/threonine-protein kinase [Frankia gtarii]